MRHITSIKYLPLKLTGQSSGSNAKAHIYPEDIGHAFHSVNIGRVQNDVLTSGRRELRAETQAIAGKYWIFIRVLCWNLVYFVKSCLVRLRYCYQG